MECGKDGHCVGEVEGVNARLGVCVEDFERSVVSYEEFPYSILPFLYIFSSAV